MDGDISKILIGAFSVFIGSMTGSISKIIEAYADGIVKKHEAVTSKEIEKILKGQEEFENKITDYFEIVENTENLSENTDTVIVAVGGTNDWNIKNTVYYCQKGKEFREGTKYIGFYKNGIVTGYGEKSKMNEEDIKKLPLTDTLISERIHEHDFYRLHRFVVTNIVWKNLGKNPVMSRQYIALHELNK